MTGDPMPKGDTIRVRGGGGITPYLMCSHPGCQKKARQHDTDHDCCGRCPDFYAHWRAERGRSDA